MFRRIPWIPSTFEEAERATLGARVGVAPLEVAAEDEWLVVRVRQHTPLFGAIAGSVLLGVFVLATGIGSLYAWTTHGWRQGVSVLVGAVVYFGFATMFFGAIQSAVRVGAPVFRYDRRGDVVELPRQKLTHRGCTPTGVDLMRIMIKGQGADGPGWMRVDQLVFLFTDSEGQPRRALVCHSAVSLQRLSESLAETLGIPITYRWVGWVSFERWEQANGPVEWLT